MPFSIKQFNAVVSRTGFGRTNYFEGAILNPPSELNDYAAMRRNLPFRIEALNLPGRTLQGFQQTYFGPPREISTRASYNSCNFTVAVSKDFRERELFMRWQDAIIGRYRVGDRKDYSGMWDTEYYDFCIGTMAINVYSNPIDSGGAQKPENYETCYTVLLEEAFPISINDMALAWGDEGYARLQVEMRYRFASEKHNRFNSTKSATREKNQRERANQAII